MFRYKYHEEKAADHIKDADIEVFDGVMNINRHINHERGEAFKRIRR